MIKDILEYNNYIFDCDGVVLDSNSIKTETFSETLDDEKESHRNQFIEYHKSNTGVSRYEKFNNYLKNIKNEDDYSKELEFLLKKFSTLLKKRLIECELTEKTIPFLEYLNSKQKNIFLVSASDQNELIDIFKQRKLDKYFKKILGSPANKIENINSLKNSHLLNGRTIFFGDSKSDYDAAIHFKFDFIFISRYSIWEIPKDIKRQSDFVELRDFSKLKKILDY